MNNIIKELWHGNIVPQSDSRNNSPEMKQLMEYMARHHDDLLKTKKKAVNKYQNTPAGIYRIAIQDHHIALEAMPPQCRSFSSYE